jgi:hypothetical protein
MVLSLLRAIAQPTFFASYSACAACCPMYMDWEDDSPGQASFGPLELEETEVLVYNPSGLNLPMQDHFSVLEPMLPIAIGGRIMSPCAQECPSYLDDASPSGLLSLAVYCNSPELYVPVLKQTRFRCKSKSADPNLAKALAMLQANPSAVTAWRCNGRLRKAAHREYARQYSLRKCVHYREALEMSRRQFFNQPAYVIGSWGVMSEVSRLMYSITARGKVLNPLPGNPVDPNVIAEYRGTQICDPAHRCHSALFTWHSDVGLDCFDMRMLIASEGTVESIERLMARMPCYSAEFTLFCAHVRDLVNASGAKCYACCLEHCRHGEKPGRVHFHAYLGSAPSFVKDGGISPPHLEIPMQMLNFRNFHAHARFTRLKGHSQAKQANVSACQGVYYIMAPKLGQLQSCSSHLPFEDLIS